jgi:thymidylate synthase
MDVEELTEQEAMQRVVASAGQYPSVYDAVLAPCAQGGTCAEASAVPQGDSAEQRLSIRAQIAQGWGAVHEEYEQAWRDHCGAVAQVLEGLQQVKYSRRIDRIKTALATI